ncbi:MAG: acetolactate synthase small subunit [Oscillospiraceae bacterium]|nr:acetolactate synthase small subunit [Oscillospiraceae bacterium]
MTSEKKLYTLSILVEDIPGVLSQVARLFSRKGYNIESIASGESKDPGITRITIVLLADENMINQIAAQCRKLLPVISVKILSADTSLQREFSLVKVRAESKDVRDEVIQVVNVFRASIVEFTKATMTVAMSGTPEKTKAFIDLLSEFSIMETVRTGIVAIERGEETIYDDTKIKEEFNYGKNVL